MVTFTILESKVFCELLGLFFKNTQLFGSFFLARSKPGQFIV